MRLDFGKIGGLFSGMIVEGRGCRGYIDFVGDGDGPKNVGDPLPPSYYNYKTLKLSPIYKYLMEMPQINYYH